MACTNWVGCGADLCIVVEQTQSALLGDGLDDSSCPPISLILRELFCPYRHIESNQEIKMKIKLLVVLMLSFSWINAIAADWEVFSKTYSGKGTIALDRSTLKRDGNIISLTLKTDEGKYITIASTAIDCQKANEWEGEKNVFEKSSGTLVSTVKAEKNWKALVPDTVGEYFYSKWCARRGG